MSDAWDDKRIEEAERIISAHSGEWEHFGGLIGPEFSRAITAKDRKGVCVNSFDHDDKQEEADFDFMEWASLNAASALAEIRRLREAGEKMAEACRRLMTGVSNCSCQERCDCLESGCDLIRETLAAWETQWPRAKRRWTRRP